MFALLFVEHFEKLRVSYVEGNSHFFRKVQASRCVRRVRAVRNRRGLFRTPPQTLPASVRGLLGIVSNLSQTSVEDLRVVSRSYCPAGATYA